jgi:hypothetical protein
MRSNEWGGNAEAGPSRLPFERPRRASSIRKMKSLAWFLLVAASALSVSHAQSATPGAR